MQWQIYVWRSQYGFPELPCALPFHRWTSQWTLALKLFLKSHASTLSALLPNFIYSMRLPFACFLYVGKSCRLHKGCGMRGLLAYVRGPAIYNMEKRGRREHCLVMTFWEYILRRRMNWLFSICWDDLWSLTGPLWPTPVYLSVSICEASWYRHSRLKQYPW
jgi:hypothetical protein